MKVAFIMSVYKNDSTEFVKQSLTSIEYQTYKNFDVYIAVDGEVNQSTFNLLSAYACMPNFNIYFHKINKGLAYRLNQLIEIVVKKNEYHFVARMDADDISYLDRLEKQVKFLSENENIDVVGSDVIEISASGDELFYKKMDCEHSVILSNIIRKCPFNHPSVMFRASIFSGGFRYNSLLMNTQDYYLWVDLLAAGKVFANINEPLLKFRINDSFHSRRGFKKAINDVRSRVYAFEKLGCVDARNIFHTIKLFILRISPSIIKKWAYSNLR